MNENEDKVRSIITTGSEMVGAAAGGAIGFVLGGPLGAVGSAAAGGAAGVAISKTAAAILTDVANRSLSHREEVRIGAATTFVVEKIKKNLEGGAQLRNDDFFEPQVNSQRSSAEEIFEGVLLKSKNEHEEKKIRIISNIFANIAFATGMSVGEANHILKLAEDLTYRQMCFLALFERKDEIQNIKLRSSDYRKFQSMLYETASSLQEIHQLHDFGLLSCRSETSNESMALLGWGTITPNLMKLTALGKRYYLFMSLNEIPYTDLEHVAMLLST